MFKTKNSFYILIILVCLAGAAAFFSMGTPFKITDPKNAAFQARQFKFSDYSTPDQIAEAFSVMFPAGTPKGYVDAVLMKNAGARLSSDSNYEDALFKVAYYTEPARLSLRHYKNKSAHAFLYTNRGHLVNIQPAGLGYIYKDMPDVRGLSGFSEGKMKKMEVFLSAKGPAKQEKPQEHAHHAQQEEAAAADHYAPAMEAMHKNMMYQPTGDADMDFVRGMILHHEGAVDMAQIVLEKGSDPYIRKLAKEIIAAQKKEISGMKAWQAKHDVDALEKVSPSK